MKKQILSVQYTQDCFIKFRKYYIHVHTRLFHKIQYRIVQFGPAQRTKLNKPILNYGKWLPLVVERKKPSVYRTDNFYLFIKNYMSTAERKHSAIHFDFNAIYRKQIELNLYNKSFYNAAEYSNYQSFKIYDDTHILNIKKNLYLYKKAENDFQNRLFQTNF